MRVAKRAFHFCSQYPRAEIFFLAHILGSDGFPEARPARPGIEFRIRIEERVAAIHAAIDSWGVLIVERTGKSEFGRPTPRDVILQRCKLLLPLGFALAHFRHGVNTQPATIVSEFHNLDRGRIVFQFSVIGESRQANTLHTHQQAVRRGSGSPKDQPASRDFIHGSSSRMQLTLPDSSVAVARAAAAWLPRAPRALPVPHTAATVPPPRPAGRFAPSQTLPEPCQQIR